VILEHPTKPSIDSEIIVTLAKQALHNVKWYTHHYQAYDFYGCIKEFATVKISLPRYSGSTTAALQLMYEYPDSLCFVPSGMSKDYMHQLLATYTDDIAVSDRIKKNTLIMGHDSLVQIKPMDRTFIIIDQASYVREEELHRIHNAVSAKIIVELG
jgi:hypothetical protein